MKSCNKMICSVNKRGVGVVEDERNGELRNKGVDNGCPLINVMLL